jgi:hypothetical protein
VISIGGLQPEADPPLAEIAKDNDLLNTLKIIAGDFGTKSYLMRRIESELRL